MDSFEVNKIAGGVLGTLLATMGLGIAASWFYEPSTPAKPGYDLPLAAAETSGAGDSRDDALERAGLDPDEATFYQTVLTSADPNVPDAATIDVSEQVDRTLWVALLSRPTFDAAALSRRTLFVGVAFDERFDEPPVLADLTHDDLSAKVLTDDPRPIQWHLWTGPDDGSGKGTSKYRLDLSK